MHAKTLTFPKKIEANRLQSAARVECFWAILEIRFGFFVNSALFLTSKRVVPVVQPAFSSLLLAFSLGWLLSAGILCAADPDPAGVEFFEKKIRPTLVENCYKCHSAQSEKVKGGLLLDTREGLLKGGDTGPAIVPGDPEKSLLIKAVRYTDENLQMPPKDKKLSAEQVSALETWIKMGAPDPRLPKAALQADLEKGKGHWAFQPVKPATIPKVKTRGWIETPIDAFILEKLEQRRIKPSLQADKRTLIRRASFDLIGLPPTPEEVQSFITDTSTNALAKVVDRLLASPQYGERWGRHWLDIARYADTKGYVFEEERRYPYAYTYRDYVIRAFNEDLPFDRFLTEQIAADLLPLGEDKRPLAALGFLTLGRRFLNNQPDIIDDRIDVVTRGTMGLTVSCARCHDHKFDPIPTKDYYSLYGVFASCNEPGEKPLLGTNSFPKQYPEYLTEQKKREEERKNYREKKDAEIMTKLRAQVGDYLLVLHDAAARTNSEKSEALVRERKLDPLVSGKWKTYLEETRRKEDPIFAPWFAFSALSSNDFPLKAKELSEKFAQNKTGAESSSITTLFAGESPRDLKDLAERYNKMFAEVDKKWTSALASNTSAAQGKIPSALPDKNEETLRQVLYGEKSPVHLTEAELQKLFDVPSISELRRLQRKVDELDATHPGAPPRAMALVDNASPNTPHVFVRGNSGNPGAEVPRQFLALIAGEKRKPFEKGSGRLELAEAIASRDNPLTARVWVNRVWMYHFGAPLVRTPSDFGVRSDPPTHPELLDYLARRFTDDGWSLKKLHRLMLLSRVYQQSSEENPRYAKADPGNNLLWRMNRQRLDFEGLRDSLLATGGKIDLTSGGQAVDILQEPFSKRRTVYGFIDRQNLPGLFRTFDFASPDSTSPQRFYTTVPQQALFLLNNPFVVEQSRYLLQRTEKETAEERRIRRLYQIVLQREPAREEIAAGQKFLSSQSTNVTSLPAPVVWQYGYGAYDPDRKRVGSFTKLPHFTGSAWQGGTDLPNKDLGWAMLNATGGHPGNDLQHAAIRRWIAPSPATLKIRGSLSHETAKGDGVRGRVVSSRKGLLGEWVLHNKKTDIKLDAVEVEAGDTIDFVVDLNNALDSDSFTWAPLIKLADPSKALPEMSVEWSAQSEFSGPGKEHRHLNAWEKYAQVLLLSNEFAFAD